jgi:hypothetical protein
MTQHGQVELVVLPQSGGPLRELAADFGKHRDTGFEFNVMTLTVVEGYRFNALVGLEGVRQAGGGVLSTGE